MGVTGMRVLVPTETRAGETRVAATPETVSRMVKEGFEVQVEAGAGTRAFLVDDEYRKAGAAIVEPSNLRAAWEHADVILKVAPLGPNAHLGGHEARALKEGAVVIGFFQAHRELSTVKTLVERGASALAMELIPPSTRAQKMDAMSSQASIAGHKAVLLAASRMPRYVSLMMTPAGTAAASRFLILGAGVAGLQALATARRLGAEVSVADRQPGTRQAVESLGGAFVDLSRANTEDTGASGMLDSRLLTADAVIATAPEPGARALRLISVAILRRMRPGAVIVDLAADDGGTCELTRSGCAVVEGGVTILGEANLPASMPFDASALYANNVLELLLHVAQRGGGRPALDITRGALLVHGGRILHSPTAALLVARAS
jgi:H+-translocating NAD(P) transhydrogenase subunit alpha